MNFMKKIVLGIFNFSLVIFLFTFSINLIASNLAFYQFAFQQFDIAETSELSEDEYLEATSRLLDYISGEDVEIQMQVEDNGQLVDLYSADVIAHMVDVRALYLVLLKVLKFSFLGLLISSVLVYILNLKTKLFPSFKQASIILGGILIGLVMYALIDFEAFWVLFHKLLFTNDLWLIDPTKDKMILMYPQELFFSLVMIILITFTICYTLIYLLLKRLSKVGNDDEKSAIGE